MIECRCEVCGGQWDMDMEPPACTCEDGVWCQLRVDGGPWGDAVNIDGKHRWEVP